MKKYSLINNNDGNDVIELTSDELNAALFEALTLLGWSLIEDENDEDEYDEEE